MTNNSIKNTNEIDLILEIVKDIEFICYRNIQAIKNESELSKRGKEIFTQYFSGLHDYFVEVREKITPKTFNIFDIKHQIEKIKHHY